MVLGAYDDEEAAAHAYDLAALKYWGHNTVLNFPVNSLSFFLLFSLISMIITIFYLLQKINEYLALHL